MSRRDDTEAAVHRRAGTGAVDRHWHTIHRSRLFVTLPAAVLVLLAVNFLWEAVRANASVDARDLPWRLSVVDLPTTANLLAVFGGLMLARAQFARTMRPHFGYSWMEEDTAGYAWSLYFHNGGPGHAQILAVTWSVSFQGADGTRRFRWLPDLEDELRVHGLGPADVELLWLGRAPVVPQQRATDGFRLGRFSYRALAVVDTLDIEITAEDGIGDRHTLFLRSTARLPSKAVAVVEATRAAAVPAEG
ncbi:hypothetical protein [Micromonospora coxensis]|uniref:hypothetical protein n=1 Tax=Micromonospora coxensis TaxID=356852 RepID=UPI003443E969